MVTNADEVSQTIPRRGGARDVARVPVLLLAGGGGSLASMQGARMVPVGEGLEIGRRSPPAAPGAATAPDARPTLVLPDKSVSSLHARIVKITDPVERTESFEIHDLGSTNGTYLDGRQISGAAALRSGSLIFLGS